MTDKQINDQVKAIKDVAKTLASSPEKAAAFLKAAGIPSTPPLSKPRKNPITRSSK